MTTTTTGRGIDTASELQAVISDATTPARVSGPLVIQAEPDLQIVYGDLENREAHEVAGTIAVESVARHAQASPLTVGDVAKRAFDITVALVALAVSLPVWVVVLGLSLINRDGPALYAQERIGRHGRMFRCWKFRTMYTNADDVLQQVLDSDPELAREWAEDHKLSEDPRVTPLGRILRRFDLDEIPQFFNVLRGDMSVVGPRPVVLAEAPKFGELLPTVLSVRPGLTGLWQVSGRNELTYRERVEHEASYVQTRSFTGDIGICLRTPITLLQRNGER